MSYSIQEINFEGVSPEQVQYLANLIESNKHHDANTLNKGEVPKLQQLVLNKCLNTIADENDSEVFVQSCPDGDNTSNTSNSYYMVVSANGNENQGMYGAEMDIERLHRTNPSYNQDPCMTNANTSFGEDNILDHLSRQVAMQQQYIYNAMNMVPTGLDCNDRCYSENERYYSPLFYFCSCQRVKLFYLIPLLTQLCLGKLKTGWNHLQFYCVERLKITQG